MYNHVFYGSKNFIKLTILKGNEKFIKNFFAYSRTLESGLEDRSMDEILESIIKIPINYEKLAHWVMSVEITAKHIRNDRDNKIIFKCNEEMKIDYFLEDLKSRDCLVKAIEVHLPQMPETLQGFFSVLKYNLKKITF